MVTTGNLNLSPEALAALAQKANRSDNELARSLGISMDEIVDAQLPDTDANNKQIFESNPFFDPTKFGQALAANARVDAGGYITAEEINKSENGNDEENDLLDIIQNNLAREEAERERIRSIQDDYNHTFTNEELDQMEWNGDHNAIWTIGGRQISRNQLFNATKKARTNWEESEEAQNMSPEERERVQRIWSQLGQISIRDAEGEARFSALVRQLPPDAQAQLNEQMGQEIGKSVDAKTQNDARRSLSIDVSTNQGATVISDSTELVGNSQNLTTVDVSVNGDIQTNVNARSDFNNASANLVAPQSTNSIGLSANQNVVNPIVRIQMASLDSF